MRMRVGLLVLPAVLVLALAWASVASAVKPGCMVVDTNANQSYASLQAAVNAASAGDTLFVKGTCVGTSTIDRNLTITGQSNGGHKTATLDGAAGGTVLTINAGVTATLKTLVVTNGAGTGINGGGITSNGTLTVNNSTISGNSAAGFGGGVLNRGALTVNDSTISGNTAATSGRGGGIYNNAAGTVVLNNTNITGNTASAFGGGILTFGPHLSLNGTSTISGNYSQTAGGIYAGNAASVVVTLNDQSRVAGNTAVGAPGISLVGGSLTLNGSSTISNNQTSDQFVGGGVSIQNGGVVTLNDNSSIRGNKAYGGAGIANIGGAVTMNDSSIITGNTAGNAGGGGIWNFNGGTVTMNGSSLITANTTTATHGGGILNYPGSQLNNCVAGTNVYNNTPDNIYSV